MTTDFVFLLIKFIHIILLELLINFYWQSTHSLSLIIFIYIMIRITRFCARRSKNMVLIVAVPCSHCPQGKRIKVFVGKKAEEKAKEDIENAVALRHKS